MKFMKLGSKPDSFQTDGKNQRYVASELASDITVHIGDAQFFLHKFPLLSKSALLQRLVATATENQTDEVFITDIPGGAEAFEICAKFCYGMTVTLNAHNVVVARCAADFLEMHESLEKGNLVYKIDVFLSSSIFRGWKDSIIVLQTTISIPEELKLTARCVEAIASKACVDVARVDWSYSYNRKKLPEENGTVAAKRGVPGDWWVEDLCELEVDLYKRVVASIKSKTTVSSEIVGEALKAYAYRRLPGFGKGAIQCGGDAGKYRKTVETIARLLPAEKGSVSCGFLLRLLKAASLVGSGESVKNELVKRIGQQLEAASVADIMIQSSPADESSSTMYDVGIVRRIVAEFLRQDEEENEEEDEIESLENGDKFRKRSHGILSDASKLMVAKLIDGYLAEIAKDPNLPLSTFVDLADMVSLISRPSHDGIYRAIDMYLKEHAGVSKGERKRICKLMETRRLSAEACSHAVQNERLPLRVVVQVLFFEQARANAASGSSTPDLPKNMRGASHGSSSRTDDEDWDAVATADELRSLRGELASLRLSSSNANANAKSPAKLRGKKIFARLWSNKASPAPADANSNHNNNNNNSGSDSSGSLGSGLQEEAKSTPSRNRRHSVS